MDLIELTQGVSDEVIKQIEYIHSAFREEFPKTLYDERKQIVGIGEPNRYLFCYFKREEGKVLVKFKSEHIAAMLPITSEYLATCINMTIDLFKRKNLRLGSKQGNLSPIAIEERPFPDLYFCNDLEKIKKEIAENEEFFEQMTIELKQLLSDFICQTTMDKRGERDKNICLCLLEQRKNRLSLDSLKERHGISSVSVKRIFVGRFSRLAYKMLMQTEEGERIFNLTKEYLERLSNRAVDAFMTYLRRRGYEYLLHAFIIFMLRKGRAFKETKKRVYEAHKQIKSKPKTINYNGFKVFMDADRNMLTDLELLDKLRAQRLLMASGLGVDEKWIYKNSQLVLLATEKPTDKESYSRVIGDDSGWEEYGLKMVEQIKTQTK